MLVVLATATAHWQWDCWPFFCITKSPFQHRYAGKRTWCECSKKQHRLSPLPHRAWRLRSFSSLTMARRATWCSISLCWFSSVAMVSWLASLIAPFRWVSMMSVRPWLYICYKEEDKGPMMVHAAFYQLFLKMYLFLLPALQKKINLYSASRMKCWVAQLRQWVSQSITFPVYCPSPSACLCPHQWVAQMQISGSFLQASYSLAIRLLFLSPE